MENQYSIYKEIKMKKIYTMYEYTKQTRVYLSNNNHDYQT